MNIAARPLAGRLCLLCGNVENLTDDLPIWPLARPCQACGNTPDQRDGIATFAPELADTLDGFDPKLFETLAALEERHFWFLARSEIIVRLIRKYFPAAETLLEIGCGNGAVLNAISVDRQWDRLVGSELHPTGLSTARRRLPSSIELVQMDARNIPAVGVFDIVGAFDVLEHIADDEGVIKGMRRAAKLGAGIIVAVPQHPWLWSRSDDVAHHERRYRRGELEEKLTRNGFEVIFSSSYNSLLMPLMIFSRMKDGGKDKNEAMDREFSVSPFVNSMLLKLLCLEIKLTLAGLSWPVGGSRIVVARAI